jgi:hypothetical protein
MRNKKGILAIIAIVLGAAALGYGGVPDQPHMQEAREHLSQAKAELDSAEHNKGGHRDKAIRYVNSALTEVDRGIEFDRRHNHAVVSDTFASPAAIPDQPHMRAALDHLREAKRSLEAANDNKGGHRLKALGDVDKAIDEVNRGIEAGR